MMAHCRQCDARLTPDEKVCFNCDSAVPPAKPKMDIHLYFRRFVNGLFMVFVAMTIAAPFTDMVPSIYKCLAGLAICVLVRNSADQMDQSRKN